MTRMLTPRHLAAALLTGAAFICSAGSAEAAVPVQQSCKMHSANNAIQRIVFLVFDNTHLSRDNPNVPSDIEQMPALLNFLQQNGTVMSNHHTSLISHTTTGVVTSLTGLYGDRMGLAVSNSYNVYTANGRDAFPSAFTYWTAKVLDPTQNDKTPNMINELGVTAPAPWVPFTRAGCDFGAYSTANVEFENVNTSPTGDIATVFGPNSPEFAEAGSNRTKATADFEGIAIHCAIGSPLCNGSANAKPDLLPNEAGGYKGYKALFGNKYVQPAISPSGPVVDLNGAPVNDGNGNNGFPGFSGPVPSTLGYVATMLEAGVPVVTAYLTDSHDNPAGGAFGPGEAGYVALLQSNNAAFATFFERLSKDGINPSNTLFVVTADEGDHFVGTPNPTPAGCDGVTVPCTYTHGGNDGHGHDVVPPAGGTVNIGEISANLNALVTAQSGDTQGFDYHFDDAPTILVFGTPGTGTPGANSPTVVPGIPSQTAANVRQLEREMGALTVMNPLRGTVDNLAQRMVDHAGMSMIHMITKDPLRNPTFVMFGNADYFFSSFPTNASLIENSAFAWDHGDFQKEIGQTWLGIAGPGVNVPGAIDSVTWSDHVDIRPTVLALTGLRDSYVHDGRVLVEAVNPSALPQSLASSSSAYTDLSVAFKQINAAFQALGEATMKISTIALKSGSAQDDSTYTSTEAMIVNLTAQRDALVAQMKPLLNSTAFKGATLSDAQVSGLIAQANALVAQAQAAAAATGLPDQ